ncbi:PD-(D/E)XK motif protein [Pseudoduganella sp. FT93W]|uniref:PD-(D/E)XK motif protein n=1 Tax=Duganella fentianensis TaxID=2692177 RepID=A0A845HY27_9BURK|nr:MZA anti-phage system associated PD-(D/E)XK motif protein MzaD [Duganella fentianensis]MYN45899.1 PD-(D/E)XK motif protein [Duganella fentianensis]
MPQPINDQILAAWRALSAGDNADGWRSIAISGGREGKLLAARLFPQNCEALLAGFDGVSLPALSLLPSGSGFRVERISTGNAGTWLALVRQPQGSVDMFARMAADLVSILSENLQVGEQLRMQLYLGRIRAWQHFMSSGGRTLGPEAELGLAGELHCLDMLIDAGIPVGKVVEAWLGPFDGLQDFALGHGAIEVKSTLAQSGFRAKILSLEQLDDSVRSPLFVCGCRFACGPTGQTLPERIVRLRERLSADSAAFALFDSALLRAEYTDSDAQHYTRALVPVEVRFLEVNEAFPRLLPGTVPDGVRAVRYEVELDSVRGRDISLAEVIEMIGLG